MSLTLEVDSRMEDFCVKITHQMGNLNITITRPEDDSDSQSDQPQQEPPILHRYTCHELDTDLSQYMGETRQTYLPCKVRHWTTRLSRFSEYPKYYQDYLTQLPRPADYMVDHYDESPIPTERWCISRIVDMHGGCLNCQYYPGDKGLCRNCCDDYGLAYSNKL
jgi:hypothetical protein